MKVIISLLLMAMPVVGQVSLDESGQRGILRLVLLTALGEPIHGNARISVRRTDRAKPRQEPMTIGLESTLPYGNYQLSVQASPAYPVEKNITIGEPEQTVIVGLFLAPIELPVLKTYTSGSISVDRLKQGCKWVRLISLVSEFEYRDSQVQPSGRFVFSDVKAGRYLLVVFGEAGVCDTSQVVIQGTPGETLRIIPSQPQGL